MASRGGQNYTPEQKARLSVLQEVPANALDELLSPKQFERLQQIAYRMEIVQKGFSEAIASGWLGEAVDLTPQQGVDLAARITAIQMEAENEITQLKHSAETEVVASLAPSQRKKLHAAVGDYFEYHTQSMQQTYHERAQQELPDLQSTNSATERK